MAGENWAIIMAGGEGTRLRSLIERCVGFPCPKQYVTFCGNRSMIEHTVDRAVELVGEERIVTVIGPGHTRYLQDQDIRGTVIEQPVTRGTGAGVYLPTSYILAQDPEAKVLILPSDHFICPQSTFLAQVETALRLAGNLTDRLVLLGARPDRPETDYGWVELGPALQPKSPALGPIACQVKSFHEKPCKEEAHEWFSKGYLWNTMIVAAKIGSLWRIGRRLLPGAFCRFEAHLHLLKGSLDRGLDRTVMLKLLRRIQSFDFSGTILTRAAKRSVILPLEGVLWSDWGRPERIFSTLRQIQKEPRLRTAGVLAG